LVVSLIGIIVLLFLGFFGLTLGGSSSSSGSGTATTAAIRVCERAQLRPALHLQGAAGSREGELVLTNTGGACAIESRPRVRVVAGRQAPIRQIPPLGRAQPRHIAVGATVVTRIRWGNWCGGRIKGLSFQLSAVGPRVVAPFTEAPPCNGPGLPSTLEVGAFTSR
jgi:hypothetical protein